MATGLVTKSNSMEFTVGASGNYSGFYGVGSENLGGDTTSEAGAFTDSYPSVFIEIDTGQVAFGLDYVPSDISTPRNTNLQTGRTDSKGQKTNTVKAAFSDLMTFYGVARLPVYGLYIKAGYSMVDVKTQESLGTGGSYGDVDTEGYTLGFGVEHQADNGIKVRAEVMAAAYDDVSAISTAASTKKVDIDDMMGATARLSIAKTF